MIALDLARELLEGAAFSSRNHADRKFGG